MTAAAGIGSSIIGPGAQIWGANKASKAQSAAQERALALIREIYGQSRADLMPFMDAGKAGINPLLGLVQGNPEEIQANLEQLPGYQFALQQGLKAQQNSATARGLGVSGAALKGGANFATGLADQTYGNQFNRLLGLTQLGANSAAQSGQIGASMAGGGANALTGLGNAQAAGYNATGQAIAGAGQGVANTLLLQQLLGGGGGGAIPSNRVGGDLFNQTDYTKILEMYGR